MAVNFYTQINKFFAEIAQKIYNRAFGLQGGDYIQDTNLHTGRWQAIKANGGTDVIFTTLTTKAGDNLDGWTLLAGDVLYGDFIAQELAKGRTYSYYKQ